MNGTDLAGWALIISAIFGPMSLILIAWMSRKVAQVQSTADESLRQTTAINHAVNGKGPRESTISEDVITIREKQEQDTPSSVVEERGVKQVLEELLVQVTKLDKEG